MWFFTSYRYFLKEGKKLQFNQKAVLKVCLQCTPFYHFVEFNLQHLFWFGLWRAVLK